MHAINRSISLLTRHAYAAIACAVAVAFIVLGFMTGWHNMLLTPDQRGAGAMRHERYKEAADSFADPLRRGVALFRAGEFKDAAQVLAALDTAEAAYDQGNALVMLGQYDNAVGRYDRALELRPGWAEAESNRTLAKLRAERMKTTGGDTGNTDSNRTRSSSIRTSRRAKARTIRRQAASPCPTRRSGRCGCAGSRRNLPTSCARNSPTSSRNRPAPPEGAKP